MAINLDKVDVGDDHPPYVIAEISCNNNGRLDTALDLIRAAKQAGANAVKFQAYTADTITMNSRHESFYIKEGLWKGYYLYDLYKKSETPFEWFPHLFDFAREQGITPFASVFDRSSVDMLERLDCPFYKIASFEFTDVPLVEYVASTGKPIILSTGMASHDEIKNTVNALPPWHSIALLHCISSYPAQMEDTNLWMIQYLKSNFLVPVGFSDHAPWIMAAPVAIASGACIIEKHIMLQDGERPLDYEFSLGPSSFALMTGWIHAAWKSLQAGKRPESETASRSFRRSIYAVRDISSGEVLSSDNIRSIRPGAGLPASLLPLVLGKVCVRDVSCGCPLLSDDVEMDAK